MRAKLRHVVEVFDAATGTPLRGVTIDQATDRWRRSNSDQPGRAPSPPVASGDPPLLVEVDRFEGAFSEFRVVAADFAPAIVRLPLDAPIRARVELARSGTLAVTLQGAPPDGSVAIELQLLDDVERDLRRHREWAAKASDHPEALRWCDDALARLARGPDPAVPLDRAFAQLLPPHSCWRSEPFRGDTTTIADLPPGRIAIQLVVARDGGHWTGGVAVATVMSETTTTVALALHLRAPPPRIAVHGLIVLAPERAQAHAAKPVTVILKLEKVAPELGCLDSGFAELRCELSSSKGSGRIAFDFGPQLPGVYRLELPDFGLTDEITVRSEGCAPTEIAVAAAAEVELALVHPANGRVVDRAYVSWAAGKAASSRFALHAMRRHYGPRFDLVPDLASGRFRFSAPAGAVKVAVTPFDPHFESLEVERELAAGPVEWTIPLVRRPLFRLWLRDGLADVALSGSVRVDLEQDGAPVRVDLKRPNSGALLVLVPAPGRYRVALSSIDGYDDPAPVEVDVGATGCADLVLPVQRRA